MNRGSEVRQTLMTSAIRVVAAQGIQNATTKAVATEAGFSEVYIYRFFESKDDLFSRTFDALDKELMILMLNSFKKAMSDESKASAKAKFKAIFHDFWVFTLGDKNKCYFFIQYYYSYFYSNHSEEARKAIYQPLLDLITPVFSTDADPWVELNHMYDFIFSKLLRVIRNTMPESQKTEEEIFGYLFSMIEPQLNAQKRLCGN